MPELTREEKIKTFENLPKTLQDLMGSEDTGAFLLYLGEKYNLDDDKISFLSKILGDVILGILPAENLVSDINAQITNDIQIATKLAQELNDLIINAKEVSVPTPRVGTPTPVERGVGEVVDLRRMPPPPAFIAPPISAPRPTAPEIIDLRNQPKAGPLLAETPPLTRVPVAAAPIPPKPLTFTKPILPPTPLIEASPHENLSRLNLDRSADAYREKIDDSPLPPISPKPIARPEEIARPKEPEENDESFILRPPGFPPSDIPDVLDLRKDKGEF